MWAKFRAACPFFLRSTGNKDATHIPGESCKWPANKSRMNCSWEHKLGSAKAPGGSPCFQFQHLGKVGGDSIVQRSQ